MLADKWKSWVEMKADLNYSDMGSLWTSKRNEFIEKITTGIEKQDNGLPYLVRSWKPEESKLTSYIYGNLTKRFGHTQRTIEGFGEQMVGMEKAEDVTTGAPTAVKIKTNKIDKNLSLGHSFFPKESILCHWCYFWDECSFKTSSNPARLAK